MKVSQHCLALLSTGLVIATTPRADATTTAPNANMRYATLSTQRDDEHNQETLGTLSVTVGDHAWVQAGGGRATIEQAAAVGRRPNILMGGVGAAGENVQFALNYTDRRDGSAYRQSDWNAAVDWHDAVWGIGFDGAHRNAHLDSTVPTAGSQGVVYVPVSQSISGNGFGVHAHLDATDELTLFAAGMKYHYTDTVRQGVPATSTASGLNSLLGNSLTRPLLAETTLVQSSFVTRDQAVLDRTFGLGATYRFAKVGLTFEYLNDQVLDAPGTVDTLQLKAGINVAPHWLVTPGIGHSQSKQYGGVNYGMLMVGYSW